MVVVDARKHDAAALAARLGQHIAHEVDAAALPRGTEHLGDGGLDAFVSCSLFELGNLKKLYAIL